MGQNVCGFLVVCSSHIDTCTCQIFVRAFDLDERLVGVAFLDVGVYVTSKFLRRPEELAFDRRCRIERLVCDIEFKTGSML